jgi:hypothetical protein
VSYLHRLVAEGNRQIRSAADFLREAPSAVRATLRDLVHNRKRAGAIGQFRPESLLPSLPARSRNRYPTEKGSGSDPPR